MYTAADLILVLQRRLQLIAPHLRRPPGTFPPGWENWFASMPARADAITGATAPAIVDALLQRPLAERPRRTGELTRWQAFNTLWRQDWHAPEPEDRRVRWFAGAFTLLWHLFFGGLLLWLMYTRFIALEEEASKRRGEEVVQVEFIGRGAPEEAGGGEGEPDESERERQEPQAQPQRPQEQAVAEAAAEPQFQANVAAPGVPPIDAPIPEVEQRDVPEPQVPPAPPAQQPVAVSAPTPEPAEFVLPPPSPVLQPQVTVPELAAPARELQAIEVPEPVQPIRREAPRVQVAVPQIDARTPEVVEREVTAPVQRAAVRDVAAPTLPQPAVRAPELAVRTRDIPAPASGPAQAPPAARSTQPAAAAASTTPARAVAPGAAAPGTAAAPGAAASTRPAGAGPAATAGQGPRPVTAPGGFPTPVQADDWGDSTRNVPGGQRGEPSGLYDAEGGPRLTDEPVNTGQPPGTVDDRIVDLDRSGTWLKRKPTDYEPTAFDKYWRPHENLLQEWVRKGIKKMAIPIPGTNKKIECLVSILALGGACGISDPNLNEQPAGARPPPDIPFKPHLQEDNGSVPPPPGG